MKICVYIKGKNIYNGKDMSYIDSIAKLNRNSIYKSLRKLTSKYKVNIYIIDFNQLIRNELYCLDPEATVIINPACVSSEIGKKLNYLLNDNEINEEIAVTYDIEEQLTYNWIYSFADKNEALTYYKMWQMNVPIGIKAYHDIIKLVDYYEDEIFNYFENKDIIDGLQHKIEKNLIV